MEHRASTKWCVEVDVGKITSQSSIVLTYMYTNSDSYKIITRENMFWLNDCKYNWMLRYTCISMAMLMWQMIWALFSEIYRIWIRAAHRFELTFSDRYTLWCRIKVKNLNSNGWRSMCPTTRRPTITAVGHLITTWAKSVRVTSDFWCSVNHTHSVTALPFRKCV